MFGNRAAAKIVEKQSCTQEEPITVAKCLDCDLCCAKKSDMTRGKHSQWLDVNMSHLGENLEKPKMSGKGRQQKIEQQKLVKLKNL